MGLAIRCYDQFTPAGCQCAKTAVDWCGCSPLTLRNDDAVILREHSSFRFFARKFDPRLDMEVVAETCAVTVCCDCVL